jgi:hypothetical protein
VLVGGNAHGISAQYASRKSIALMHSLLASAQWCLIHDVIMDKREIVKQLNAYGSMPGIGMDIAKQFCAHEAKHWSYALAAEANDVPARLVKRIGSTCKEWGAAQPLLELGSKFLERIHE